MFKSMWMVRIFYLHDWFFICTYIYRWFLYVKMYVGKYTKKSCHKMDANRWAKSTWSPSDREELMDQMCMSMVKLQGRLQFSQARAGADGVVVDERWWVLADKVAAGRLEGFGGLGGCFFSDVVCCCMLYGFWFISGGGCWGIVGSMFGSKVFVS